VDLVKAWGWKTFTIVYETDEGLVRIQELLKAHGPTEFPIAVRQLSEGNDYRYASHLLWCLTTHFF
jgi:glutamate receptor, ionotropic, invertebrate